MTQQQLEKYLWGTATALRGTLDAGDYKQYIFPLLFFKRICDVYDEGFETALTESGGDMEYAGFDERVATRIVSLIEELDRNVNIA
jgi:type I restriction enzyme M protein